MNEQIYYHFLSSNHAIDDLQNKYIKVGTLDTLNDPFEMMPYRRYSFKERQPYNRVFKRITKKWGLLCFSSSDSLENQLIWAHYGGKHKGVALGFEILKDKIIKVKYTPDRIRTRFKLTDDPKVNEEKFLGLAGIKYEEWAHEKEYRIWVKLEECEQKKGLYFMKFKDRLKVKKIVLGHRFNDKNEKENIVKLTKQLGIEISQIRTGFEDYMMHICGTKTNQLQEMLKRSIK